jgi:hypothetical protein
MGPTKRAARPHHGRPSSRSSRRWAAHLLLAGVQAERGAATGALQRSGGPAPLTVNSSKLLKHLNPDQVGGKSASELEPKTIRFHLGSPGETFGGNTQHVFSAKVSKGTYQLGLTGLITQSTSTSGDSYTCLIADKAKLLALLRWRLAVELQRLLRDRR